MGPLGAMKSFLDSWRFLWVKMSLKNVFSVSPEFFSLRNAMLSSGKLAIPEAIMNMTYFIRFVSVMATWPWVLLA